MRPLSILFINPLPIRGRHLSALSDTNSPLTAVINSFINPSAHGCSASFFVALIKKGRKSCAKERAGPPIPPVQEAPPRASVMAGSRGQETAADKGADGQSSVAGFFRKMGVSYLILQPTPTPQSGSDGRRTNQVSARWPDGRLLQCPRRRHPPRRKSVTNEFLSTIAQPIVLWVACVRGARHASAVRSSRGGAQSPCPGQHPPTPQRQIRRLPNASDQSLRSAPP